MRSKIEFYSYRWVEPKEVFGIHGYWRRDEIICAFLDQIRIEPPRGQETTVATISTGNPDEQEQYIVPAYEYERIKHAQYGHGHALPFYSIQWDPSAPV